MTVKKRLFLSNILMIVVPVVITAIVGLLCIVIIWFALQNGLGLGLDGSEEFYGASYAAVHAIEHAVDSGDGSWPDDLSTMEELLNAASMRLVATNGTDTIYSYGTAHDVDETLTQAVELLGTGQGIVSNGTRGVFLRELSADGRTYQVYIYGTQSDIADRPLKLIIVFAGILLIFTVFASIVAVNRFLTKFVFQKIEGPLDILAGGVREIGAGNLDFRICYDNQDEFLPVCSAFNEMAARLKASVERTQQDEESRKELLAGISHDLRSPLTSIQAYVEGLLDGVAKTPDAQQRYLSTIKAKAEDIDRLVSQLFLFSKLELDEYPMELHPIRLDELVMALEQETKAEYQERGLILGVETAPITAMADGEHLRRVLTNIMDNSVKYKMKDVGHLHICVEDGGTNCRLTLSDDGPGVASDALPKLFDVFYRSDSARKDPAGGSGLGLAIAAKIIQRMGGTIDAANGPGSGLTITITLPKEAHDCA